MLNCPGIPGCGQVEARYGRKKITSLDGEQHYRWCLVCPICGTRLLPTAEEIARTRGVA